MHYNSAGYNFFRLLFTFVTPERNGKGKTFLVTRIFAESSRISGQFLAGYLVGLVGSFEKKSNLHCLESSLESGRIVTWHGRQPGLTSCFLHSYLDFG